MERGRCSCSSISKDTATPTLRGWWASPKGRRRRSYFERAVCYGRSWSDERTRAARRRQPFAEEHRAATRLVAGHRGSAGSASSAAVVLDSARCRGGGGRGVAGQKPTPRLGRHPPLRGAPPGDGAVLRLPPGE